MKKRTYKIIQYVLMGLIVANFIGFGVELAVSGVMNTWASLCLSIGIISIFLFVILSLMYGAVKVDPKEKPSCKNCKTCGTPNDLDALYCKHCGKKF